MYPLREVLCDKIKISYFCLLSSIPINKKESTNVLPREK